MTLPGLSNAVIDLQKNYLLLAGTTQDIIQKLWWHFNEYNGNVYLLMRQIAAHLGCKVRNVQHFLAKDKDLLALMFKIVPEYDQSGRQTANRFIFEKDFIQAMRWLEIYGYLKPKKKNINKIFEHIESERLLHPPPPFSSS